MFTMITLTEVGHSTHTLYSREDAERMFYGCIAGPPGFVEAIFLYGPEGMINNWLKELANG